MTTNTNPPSELQSLVRKSLSRIITAALDATAEELIAEREGLLQTGAEVPKAFQVNEQALRAFTQSPAFVELLNTYIHGPAKCALLVAAVDLLRQTFPELFE